MRPCHKVLPALLMAAGVLHSQEPAPICGLPEIVQLPVEETTVLYRRGIPTDNPTFLIREHYTSSTLIEVEFYLMHDDAAFSVYVEAAEWDSGNVDAPAVDTLVAAFRDHTFEGSIDPDRGIKPIAEDVFGPPPDIDHNGKVFILLIDVRDDFVLDSSETYVAGYFDPLDQGQRGNLADIIYLDTNPGTFSGPQAINMFSTLAHEYQHLIHYGWDTREATWINEGLSELSPVLMGIPLRDLAPYLSDTNVRLDSFGNELVDYARSGLFFIYTWIQLGTRFIQDLIRNPVAGISGFNVTLSDHHRPDLDSFVFDWHVANFIQGEGTYGYHGLFAVPQPVMHDVISSYPQDNFQCDVKRLGARWTLVTSGNNLYLLASRFGNEPSLTLINGDNRTLIAAPQLSSIGFQDPAFGEAYDDLIVLATASTAVADSVTYTLFIDAEGGFEEVTLAYDGNETPKFFVSLGDGELAGEAAVSFNINDNAELGTIQFMCLTSDSVDVRLYRQSLNADSILYTETVAAPLGLEWTTHRLPRGLQVENEPIYVSVRSVANALAYNENTRVSYSYYMPVGENTFFPLDTFAVNEEILIGNWSIRLTYLVPDTSGGELQIPVLVSQFYPNPFTGFPLTRLIVSPGHSVALTLYNILGQEVCRLTRPADLYEPLFWDGRMNNGLPAPTGIYLARVVIGNTVINRKITLLR